MRNKNIIHCVVVAILLFLLLFATRAFVLWNNYKNYKEVENAVLQHDYYHQNIAFGMENASRNYQDYSYVSVNSLIINLATYCFYVEGVDITVEDIEEFLSSEYDENEQLKVLNPPQKIGDYLEWYWTGGDEATREYLSWLFRYQLDHKDVYGADDLLEIDEKSLCKMIDEFNSCPDQDIYLDFDKWQERHFGKTQNEKIEIVVDKSYLSDFVVQDGETKISCILTFKNTSNEDITFSVKAHFTDDFESGLVSDEYVIGICDDTEEDVITIKAGEIIEYKEISFYSKNNGCETKNDRLLPDLTIEEVN